MSLKILTIHPDEAKSQAIQNYFNQRHYETILAMDGRTAQLKIYQEKLFAVILSLDIRSHTGLQVLNFIKSAHPTLKVIILCNKLEDYFDDPKEGRDDLLKVGVIDVIEGEYTLEQLNKLIEGEQSYSQMMLNVTRKDTTSAEAEVEGSDEAFTPVRIDEFRSSKNVLFDVFVRIKKDKYIKILHSGDLFSPERIDSYKAKNTEFLYFNKTDRQKFIQFCKHMFTKMLGNKKIPLTEKVAMAKNMTEKYVEEIYTEGLRPQVIEQAKEITDGMYQLLQKEKNLYKLLRDFQAFDPSSYSHAFLVSFFANMLIKQFEWESQMTTRVVGFAAMVHDLGKLKLPKELIDKHKDAYTEADWIEYKKHPEYTLEMLRPINTVPPAVKQICYQHHELSNGVGYPLGIGGPHIFTLSKVIIIANDFADIVAGKQVPPIVALKEILKDPDCGKKYNTQILDNFIKVFADPEKVKEMDKAKAM